MAAKKRRSMTKRKKIIFAFIVVIITVLLFSVVGVGVIYLGGGQQTVQNVVPTSTNTANDITVIPSIPGSEDSIQIEEIAIEGTEADGEADGAADVEVPAEADVPADSEIEAEAEIEADGETEPTPEPLEDTAS